MLRKLLSLGRHFAIIAVGGSLAASIAPLFYEGLVVAIGVIHALEDGGFTSRTAKTLAACLIEAVDILLIAIVAHMIGLGPPSRPADVRRCHRRMILVPTICLVAMGRKD
jgi:uncharacterized membrane protein YqhA